MKPIVTFWESDQDESQLASEIFAGDFDTVEEALTSLLLAARKSQWWRVSLLDTATGQFLDYHRREERRHRGPTHHFWEDIA